MSTNLISLAEQLKSFPDQWLAKEMQSPTGAIPQYLVLGELQRRKLLRSGSGAQGPTGTVAQETVQDVIKSMMPPLPSGPPPPPGMASPRATPQPLPGAKPPQNMAAGGSVDDGDTPDKSQLTDWINQYSSKYNLPPQVAMTVAGLESNFNPNAKSPKGAIGTMQLMPQTAKGLGVDPTDPEQNIEGGVKYLSQLYNDRFGGDIKKTLAGYNAGPGAVDKYNGVPPYAENYVKKGMLQLQPTPDASAAEISQKPVPLFQPPDAQAFESQPPPQLMAQNNNAPALPSEWIAPSQAGIGPDVSEQPWNAPPAAVAEAKSAEADARQQLQRLMTGHKPYDIAADLPKPPDWSREDKTIQDQLAYAQAHLHPTISQVLMNMGFALMASRSRSFGQALGEAGLYTQQSVEKQNEEGRRMYIDALKAGINLQDKKNSYDERMAQYKMQAALAGQKDWEERVREAQKEVDSAHKDYTTAQTNWQKSLQFKTLDEAYMYRNLLPPDQRANIEAMWQEKHAPKPAKAPTPGAAEKALSDINFNRSLNGQPALTPQNFGTQATDDEKQRMGIAAGTTPKPLTPEQKFMNDQREAAAAARATAAADRQAKELNDDRGKYVDKIARAEKAQNLNPGKVNEAIDALNSGTPIGQTVGTIAGLVGLAGGQGSGVRLNRNEVDMFTHSRPLTEELMQAWNKAAKGTRLTDQQVDQTKNLLFHVQNKIRAKQEAMEHARNALESTTSADQHVGIYNQMEKELNDIDNHRVSLRDSKGVLRHYDPREDMPHATGQTLDPTSEEQFRKLAGGDTEMTGALARHWGWTVPRYRLNPQTGQIELVEE